MLKLLLVFSFLLASIVLADSPRILDGDFIRPTVLPTDSVATVDMATKTYVNATVTAEHLRVSAPTKVGVQALIFNDLTSFTVTTPYVFNGYTFQEGDRMLYDGETPDGMGGNLSGDYTSSGGYSFHDNGNGTGTFSRASDWALGQVIDSHTLVHVGLGGSDGDDMINQWMALEATVTIGAGDILPVAYSHVDVVDRIAKNTNSGTIKRFVNAVSDTNVALTGVAPGTMIGGWSASDGNTFFLDNQTIPAQNGEYVYIAGSQRLFRTQDFANNQVIDPGTIFFVFGGTYQSKLIRLDGFTVGQSVGQEFPHDITSEAIGYQPENRANLKTDLTTNSDSYYPSVKAVKTAVDAKQNSLGISNAPSSFLPLSTGSLTSIVVNEIIGSGKTARAMTIENAVASAAGFTCVANPVLIFKDCGTSPGSCTGGTTLASVTLTAANTQTDGTVSVASIAAGHYWAWEVASGTCTLLNATGSAEAGMQ